MKSKFGFLVALVASASCDASLERISVSSGGTQGNLPSEWVSVSSDGRHVAFASSASNLVPGDTNGNQDIFVKDVVASTVQRVNLAFDGSQGGHASEPSISGDGGKVAFTSLVSLTPNGGIFHPDIYVRDLQANTTVLVSVATTGEGSNLEPASGPTISANGRYVAFVSKASDIVAGDTNGFKDVFVRDLQTNTTIRASVSNGGVQGNADSQNASISADGRYVVFFSYAGNFVAGSLRGGDIFVRDLTLGTTTRVTTNAANEQPPFWGASDPSVSDDGRFVSFTSDATNLVIGDTNGLPDIFVRDRVNGTTVRANLTSSGGQITNGVFTYNAISGNGRVVLFETNSDQLSALALGGYFNVYARDLDAGTTTLISVSSSGQAANSESHFTIGGVDSGALSADGRKIGFFSTAENLVAGDTNHFSDIFAFVASPISIFTTGFE